MYNKETTTMKHGQMSHTAGKYKAVLYNRFYPSIQIATRIYKTLYGSKMACLMHGYSRSAIKRYSIVNRFEIVNTSKKRYY